MKSLKKLKKDVILKMKLWIDDTRPAPNMYVWIKSVDEAKECIEFLEGQLAKVRSDLRPYSCNNIEIIDIDHDSGDYGRFGGDYIRLLDWLEETGRNYPIHIHSMNPVGVQNMRAIIERNNWKEIY